MSNVSERKHSPLISMGVRHGGLKERRRMDWGTKHRPQDITGPRCVNLSIYTTPKTSTTTTNYVDPDTELKRYNLSLETSMIAASWSTKHL
jgi:hypothetical protein